jgi:hypothetical protein
MKFAMFIHNDDVKCFHVVVQGTHKLVVMGRINFEDHALINKGRANEKMSVTGKMFKDMKKRGNHRKLFVFVVGSYARFQRFGVHNSMSAENVIEKLQGIAREKETQRNEHRQK